MNNLVKPELCSETLLNEIIEAKRESSVQEILPIKDDILKTYDLFCLDLVGRNSSLVLSTDQSKELLDLYNLPTKPLKQAKKKIFATVDAFGGNCPFCNFGEATQIDHYLAKEETSWPEYCVLIDNMVPICSKCNGHKSSRAIVDGFRCVFHPYFDAISDVCIEATVDIDGEEIKIKYAIYQNKLSDSLFGVLKNQFAILQLKNRWLKKASSRFKTIEKTFGKKEISEDDARLSIEEKLEETEEEFGKNHWCAALYRGILANDDVVRYLISRP